jgi:hypothetical protein
MFRWRVLVDGEDPDRKPKGLRLRHGDRQGAAVPRGVFNRLNLFSIMERHYRGDARKAY